MDDNTGTAQSLNPRDTKHKGGGGVNGVSGDVEVWWLLLRAKVTEDLLMSLSDASALTHV